MPLEVCCAACGETFRVDPAQAGKEATCPTCGREVTVPTGEGLEIQADLDALGRGQGAAMQPDLGEERPVAAWTTREPEDAAAEATVSGPDFEQGFLEPAPAAGTYGVDAAPGQPDSERAPVAVAPQPNDEPADSRGRLLDICFAAVAIAVALAVVACFNALWAGLQHVRAVGPTALATGFAAWVRSVPGALRMQAAPGAVELSVAGHVLVCALLVVLALRVLIRTQLVDLYYAPAEATQRHRFSGLVYHLVPMVVLLGLVALSAAVLAADEAHRLYLVGWLMACFVLGSAGWFALMRILGHFVRGGLTARMWNNGLCGILIALVLLTGGVPNLPLSGFEQCALLVLLNSLVAFALTGGAFAGKSRGRWIRGFGFVAVDAILLAAAAIIFVAA